MFSILLFLSKKRKACILARFFFVLLFASPSCSLPFRPFSAYASNITILNSERTDWVGHTWKRNEVDFGSEHRATQQQKDQPRTKSSGVQKTSRFNQCQGAEEEKEKCRKERTFVFRKWVPIPLLFLFLLGKFFLFLKASIVFPISSFLVVVVVVCFLGCVLATKGRRWCKERESGLFFAMLLFCITFISFVAITCFSLSVFIELSSFLFVVA